MGDRLRLSGVSLALIAAVLFGVSGVISADAFDAVEPLRVAQFRSLVAAVLLGIVARRGFDRDVVRRNLGWLTVFGVLLATVTISFYVAIDRLGVGPGVTLQFLGPIGVLVWIRLVDGRPIVGWAWTAAGIAFTGTVFMNRPWEVTTIDPVGVLAGLVAAVAFAGYLIVGARVGREVPSTVAVASGFAVSALIYLVALPPSIPAVDVAVWGQLVWIAVVGTALAFLIEMMALERDDPGRIGVAATLEPVVAAAGAWLALGQSLTPIQILGGGLVVAGIAVVQYTTADVGSDMPDLVV